MGTHLKAPDILKQLRTDFKAKDKKGVGFILLRLSY